MSSLISRIKDAWLVLTGKGFVSREHSKPLVMHGRLSNLRKVNVSVNKRPYLLGKGDKPVRMMAYFHSESSLNVDTSLCHRANFRLSLTSNRRLFILDFEQNGIVIKGTYDEGNNEITLSSPNVSIGYVTVLVESEEYSLIKSGET